VLAVVIAALAIAALVIATLSIATLIMVTVVIVAVNVLASCSHSIVVVVSMLLRGLYMYRTVHKWHLSDYPFKQRFKRSTPLCSLSTAMSSLKDLNLLHRNQLAKKALQTACYLISCDVFVTCKLRRVLKVTSRPCKQQGD